MRHLRSFNSFQQLCPSWDLPLLFSVHEPNDFSCSCSGLERNPCGKTKTTGIAFSTAAFNHRLVVKTLSAETLRLWRWMALSFSSTDGEIQSVIVRIVIQGKKHWKSICYAQKCTRISWQTVTKNHPTGRLIFHGRHGMNVPYHYDNNM